MANNFNGLGPGAWLAGISEVHVSSEWALERYLQHYHNDNIVILTGQQHSKYFGFVDISQKSVRAFNSGWQSYVEFFNKEGEQKYTAYLFILLIAQNQHFMNLNHFVHN